MSFRAAKICAVIVGASLVSTLTTPVRAEVSEVRIANQFGFTFLQLNVMANRNLIEKHAATLGIPNLKVTWSMFTRGADAMNDAILSKALDIGTGGVNGLITIWAKTAGTPQEIRGVSALGHFAFELNSRNPNLKTIHDYKPENKIAVPGVKVSSQALILQMAAAKEWGIENFERLDAQTFTMAAPDQTVAILSGSDAVESSFSTPPFTLTQLKDPKIHKVLSSTDLVGDATTAIFFSSKAFHDSNPTVYRAVMNALKEADAFIQTNKREAVQYFIDDTKSKTSLDEMMEMLSKPQYGYSLVPRGMMIYADFMQKTGRIKTAPQSWKDLFFPEVHDLSGS